jgi:WD40 repeat protein/energy-coupling factor transporter ATP-binding protein EcfA2
VKKLLVLNLEGNFETGFDVKWEIGPDGQRPSARDISRLALPACSKIVQVYKEWENTYRSLDGNRIKPNPNQITNVNYTDLLSTCQRNADNLEQVINQWFDSSPLSRIIDEDLLKNREDEYRIIICSDNLFLRHIPWLLWKGWEKFPHLEISLGSPYTQRRDRIYQQQVRILVILGNKEGIDIDADRQILENYHQQGAHVEFLVQPGIAELRRQLSDECGWDIISFSGHSRTELGNKGRIYINQTDSLTMAQLQVELAIAIEKGLQLAIFNSCDGLGIAVELEVLSIPQVIVMRQPVPDRVAQNFLKYFLAEFTSGKSLYQAVSIARHQLEELKSDFPCASWLPVIIQNPLEIPPTWQSLGSIPPCPYRGLAAFRSEDKDYFYGREASIQSLVKAINSQSIVILVGASGSGKSSVVFSGLVPNLGDNWQVLSLRPETNLIEALANAISSLITIDADTEEHQLVKSELALAIQTSELALGNFISQQQLLNSDRYLLLIFDQLEDLYTLDIDGSQYENFLSNIFNVVERFPQFKLLPVLRADCDRYIRSDPIWANILGSASTQSLIPMTRSELTDALIMPAQHLNVRFEANLVEKILDSFPIKDYSLPLLELIVTQLWEKQEDGYLTHSAYENIGRAEGITSTHAESFYDRSTPQEREMLRTISTQLVKVGNNNLSTRRIAKRSELGSDSWKLVNDLAVARLVAIDRDEVTQLETVELIHDALPNHWHIFSEWIKLDGNFRQWQEQLRSDITRWETSKRNDDKLLPASSLDTAVNWLNQHLQISLLEREFINLSLIKNQENNKTKRRRLIAVISTIGAMIAGLATIHQLTTSNDTKNIERLTAIAISMQEITALETAQKAVENASRNKQKSDIKLPAIITLSNSLNHIRQRKISKLSHSGVINSIAFSQDNQMIASVDNDSQLNIYDTDKKTTRSLPFRGENFAQLVISKDKQTIISFSGKRLISWHLNLSTGKWSEDFLITTNENIATVGFSLNSQTLAIALDRQAGVQLYKKKNNNTLTKDRLLKISDYVDCLKFTPDGNKIVTANADGIVKLWTVTGQLQPLVLHPSEKTLTVAISPDGESIATGSDRGNIQLWNIQGKPLDSVKYNDQKVKDLDFSPDSKILASTKEQEIEIWKIEDRKLKFLEPLPVSINTQAVNFNPIKSNIQTLVSGHTDGTSILWQINSPPPNFIVPNSNTFTYSPDGQLLAVGNHKGNITIINSKQHKPIVVDYPTNHKSKITGLSISPDRQYFATIAGNDNEIKLWKLDGENIRPLENLNLAGSHGSFSPKESIMAIATKNNTVSIYDVNGKVNLSWGTNQSTLTHLSFTPDGNNIITGDIYGKVKLWSLNGRSFREFPSSPGPVVDVSYSPDGKIAIASGLDKQAIVTILPHGGKPYTLPKLNSITSLAFSQDGNVLLTGNNEGKLQLWNLSGESLMLKPLNPGDENAEISKVRLSANDREIVAVDINGKIIYYDLDSEQLLKQANTLLLKSRD